MCKIHGGRILLSFDCIFIHIFTRSLRDVWDKTTAKRLFYAYTRHLLPRGMKNIHFYHGNTPSASYYLPFRKKYFSKQNSKNNYLIHSNSSPPRIIAPPHEVANKKLFQLPGVSIFI